MTNPDSTTQDLKLKTQNPSQGNLLGLLTFAFYILFTLLPDSNSAMVQWPWVLFWQVGLLCPMLWLLGLLWQQRLMWLGNKLDWMVGLLVVSLLISTTFAQFPNQARWYSWAAFGFLAALYTLNTWLSTPQRRFWLLTAQGYLSLALIVVSLVLWSSQVLVPELAQLQGFQQLGIRLPFDFSNIALRNGFPIGHQNYVAGYLILTLPLLLGLGILQIGWQRWVWWLGVGLGLIVLYTTSSRGGWLGVFLLGLMGVAVLLWRSPLPRRWVGTIGITAAVLLVLMALANNRLRSLLLGVTTGQIGGELAYRLITMTTGWGMGLSHLFSGVGPGGVLPLFQQYRPAWAGREAELHYQLHSTPAQVWAELGLWSVAIGAGTIALLLSLTIRWLRSPHTDAPTPPVLIGCLLAALLAYGVFSLTDYQLDNFCISGTIVIYLAVLAVEFRGQGIGQEAEGRGQRAEGGGDREGRGDEGENPLPTPHSPLPTPHSPLPTSKFLIPHPFPSLIGFGILLAVAIWLVPIHRAWLSSSQGFAALSRNDFTTFIQRLRQSYDLVPWEPYYPYQLGWNAGNLSLQMTDPKQRQTLVQGGIQWLQRGIQASPQQEFGHSNLAWLLVNRDPGAASQSFARSVQLVPAKRGVFYGLGLSLLAQKQTDLAVAAMTLEVLRDPLFITSPVWQLPDLQPLYEPVTRQVEARYTALLEKAQNAGPLSDQLHQSRGGIRWWLGNLPAARADFDRQGTSVSRLVLDLAEGKAVQAQVEQMTASIATLQATTGAPLAIAAWLDPARRQNWLQQAWIVANHSVPAPETLQQLMETMARSTTFDQWLKQNAPSSKTRRERLGFGVLNRHTDGPAPVDFLTTIDNVPMTTWFANQLLPSFLYAPELDQVLQTDRDVLLQKVLDFSSQRDSSRKPLGGSLP
ncbi:O-antigen ligase family protein [Kovacikia minuta CCNUW1]|uniref:O-antigen ligase family protein n=1 Tax=Kovacikia minuta TaxID=2931930 RepID=UPI001CCFC200|nr:O-antigen ligase family protein [Kovacikia minuta]UBF25066.1 O-antigen ligase family protein [Kovacikia minuta CCNUW1]